MKRTAALLLCVLLFSSCAKPELPAAQVPQAGLQSPQSSPQATTEPAPDAGGIIAWGGDYTPEEDVHWSTDVEWLAPYRVYPGEYDEAQLRQALDALAPLHIETPQDGPEKLYFRDRGYIGPGYLTAGSLDKNGLNALVKDLDQAPEGKTLREVLSAYGLSYQTLGGAESEELPLEEPWSGKPYEATLEELHPKVVCVTLAPPRIARNEMGHLLFYKEAGSYRFAALAWIGLEERGRDRVIENGGVLYFTCSCADGWGTGAYSNYERLYSLQEGVSSYVQYARSGYDCPLNIMETVELRLRRAEPPKEGGAHFVIEGSFAYAGYDGFTHPDFERALKGTLAFHVYDDQDGKGFYTYAQDFGTSFALRLSKDLARALEARIALMLRARDETVALLAENLLWESAAHLPDYPDKTPEELNSLLEAQREKEYTPQEGSGRYYLEPRHLPDGGGCTLGSLPGRPVNYYVVPAETSQSGGGAALSFRVNYTHYATGVAFDLPLALYDDGDGKGLYSLDPNSRYYFTDILQIPYAREQFEAQLALMAQSANRHTRATALTYMQKIFGE